MSKTSRRPGREEIKELHRKKTLRAVRSFLTAPYRLFGTGRLLCDFPQHASGVWIAVGVTGTGDWRLGFDEVILAGLRGEVFPLCAWVLAAARRTPAVDCTAAQSIFVITQEFARAGELAALPAAVTGPAPGVCDG